MIKNNTKVKKNYKNRTVSINIFEFSIIAVVTIIINIFFFFFFFD